MAKSIKDQNRWQLWFAILANVIAFYALMQWDDIAASGVKALINKAANLLPVSLAIVVTTVINGLFSPGGESKNCFLVVEECSARTQSFHRTRPERESH